MHRHFRVTDSTNARARELAAAGAPHGTVVTADEQTEGRGRQGRIWVAPRGRALLYSLLLRPLGDRPLLPLAAAIAVCEAAEETAPGIECKVKWPNDVLLEGGKLAGILIEARPQDDWAVIGIGLNLMIECDEFPPDLRHPATSLGGNVSPEEARKVLDAQLDRWVEADEAEVLTHWRARDALHGREVAWEGGSGIASGVDSRGSLIVTLSSGDRAVLGAGEVHLL
jgi:BirA family transcriptional regulator, biotin operon repressor / biotin---[acetyl-CoA-carboxylase] ligase